MTKREQKLLAVIVVGALSVVFLLRAVAQGVTYSEQQPAGLVTLHTEEGETVTVSDAHVSGGPKPDPAVDGRWWMIAKAPRGNLERWDGPYQTAESCLNGFVDSYASQYKSWQFTCAIEEEQSLRVIAEDDSKPGAQKHGD